MRFKDRICRSGYFWIPDNPDTQIPGTLSIEDGGGIRLQLFGSFAKPDTAFLGDVDAPRIVGVAEKVGAVTLDGCFETNRSISVGGVAKSDFFAHRLIEGLAYSKDEPLLLQEFTFTVDGLHPWLCMTGITAEFDFVERTAQVRYTEQQEVCLQLTDDMELRLGLGWAPPAAPIRNEAKLSEHAYIRLVTSTPKPLQNFVSIGYRITNFLCFATDRILCISNVKGAVPAKFIDSADDDEDSKRVQIVYQSLPFSDDSRPIDPHAMLFRYPQMESAEATMQKWLGAYDVFQPALDLYFAARSGAHKYLSGRFLSLAQALETYHRRTSTETVLDHDEFSVLLRQIVASCPNEHSDMIRQRLAFGNEISFFTRLQRIMEPLQDWLGDDAAREKLARCVVDNRNYLTHFDKRLKKKVLNGADLYPVCLKMEAILQLHLLREVGFSSEDIANIVGRSRALQTKLALAPAH